MDEDYMSDSESPAEEKEESKGTKTALLPLAFLAGKTLNPGDTLTLKVAKVGDDQVEVELGGEVEEEDVRETVQEPAEAPAAMGGGMEEMMG